VDNPVVVFILTMICSVILLFTFGSVVGGEDGEFTIAVFFLIQFSFTTALLFKIYDKVRKLEEKQVEEKKTM
jgi:hypothetical protein